MIRQYFNEEELKNFSCKDCINYMECTHKGPICAEFSPSETILYNKIEQLTQKNYECAKLYCGIYEETH